ncbi:hypothetical protein KGM_203628 [Danaus plexippus plexippus]|uniref:Uncharacterized protein n=1 Tax=Danaus plexippus plexippus TaxID=278856 RepID=A0A212EKX4_DANPL|nr:hypothetical protein KGM_203628 [Danaus plexippus plexippus]
MSVGVGQDRRSTRDGGRQVATSRAASAILCAEAGLASRGQCYTSRECIYEQSLVGDWTGSGHANRSEHYRYRGLAADIWLDRVTA